MTARATIVLAFFSPIRISSWNQISIDVSVP